jgi:hypothetical protein
MKSLVGVTVLVVTIGCGDAVDVSGLSPIGEYDTWSKIEVVGPVPGHGDSYRIIYANESARGYAGSGEYPNGAVIVKEVRKRNGNAPGNLEYLAIMRRLDDVPPGGTLHSLTTLPGGWLFTETPTLSEQENYFPLCWEKCHVQAPYNGLFFNYGAM